MPQTEATELIREEMAELLSTLEPKWVLQLAQMIGDSLEDANITIQLAPLGIRLALETYGCLKAKVRKSNTTYTATPKLMDAINAAHHVVMHLLPELQMLASIARFLPANSPCVAG